MKKIEFIVVLLLFSACVSEHEKKDTDTAWKENENASKNDAIKIEQDSSATKKANWITYFETKRDHTLVEIKNIELELKNEINEEKQESLTALSKKQKDVTERIETLRKATKESLEKIKIGLDSTFVDLEEFIIKVKSKVKKNKK